MIELKKRFKKLKEANLPNTNDIAIKYNHPVIIKLFYNESKFGASPKVKERLEINSPHIYPEYKEPKLISSFSKRFDLPKDYFYVSNGSDAILDSIPTLFASKSKNHNIIIPELTFGRIEATCIVEGIKVKKVNLINGKIDLNETFKQVDKNTAVIYIVNPNMPTGTLNSFKEIDNFMSKISSKALVVIDEAYYEYAVGIEEAYINDKKLIKKYDNIIITHTFSKVYGIAAFRVGYMLSRPYIVDIFRKAYQYLPINKYSIQAAKVAFEDKEFYYDVIKKTNIEKDRYYAFFDSLNIKYFKSFGNFIYLFVPNNSEIEEHLVSKYGVLIRSIRDNALRITMGTSEENDLVFKGFKDLYV